MGFEHPRLCSKSAVFTINQSPARYITVWCPCGRIKDYEGSELEGRYCVCDGTGFLFFREPEYLRYIDNRAARLSPRLPLGDAQSASLNRDLLDAVVVLKTARFACRHNGQPSFADCLAEVLLNDAIAYLEGNPVRPRFTTSSRSLDLWLTGAHRNRWTGGESIGDWINTDK